MRFSSLREKWRKSKEEERMVDEEVKKQLTPEIKLAILRSRQGSIIWWYIKAKLVLIVAVSVLVLFLVSASFCALLYGLKGYFGENVFDNIMSYGEAEAESLFEAVGVLTTVVPIIAVMFVIYFVIKFFRGANKERKLEQEILARLKADDKRKGALAR